MAKPDVYVVYNPHLDEFVRIRKFSSLELGILITDLGGLINKPGAKITSYVSHVIKRVIENSERYDLSESVESLFECVIEVYPVFQIEFVCKAVNELSDDGQEVDEDKIPPTARTLSGIRALSNKIKSGLIGQDEAVEECTKSIKLISSGLGKFVSLFFIGPTGVGKTELARSLAKEYLGSPKKLLKINCGEYSTGHEYAKLIGSPPGYVGHNEKGILSEKAEQSSKWIILFDEIEKAHPKLMNLLLGFLDDGKIVDSRGVELDFTDSIICFTSNLGMKDNIGKKLVGFGDSDQTYEASKRIIDTEFKNYFSPEFINRLDNIIYFNQLTKEDAAGITRLCLKKLPIKTTKRLVDYIVEGSFSLEYGARNIKRFIRSNVTIKLADKILEDGKGKMYKAVFKNKDLFSVAAY
jgi:ATP-dependent Clp protease ATP-binding subunit ClpA